MQYGAQRAASACLWACANGTGKKYPNKWEGKPQDAHLPQWSLQEGGNVETCMATTVLSRGRWQAATAATAATRRERRRPPLIHPSMPEKDRGIGIE